MNDAMGDRVMRRDGESMAFTVTPAVREAGAPARIGVVGAVRDAMLGYSAGESFKRAMVRIAALKDEG